MAHKTKGDEITTHHELKLKSGQKQKKNTKQKGFINKKCVWQKTCRTKKITTLYHRCTIHLPTIVRFISWDKTDIWDNIITSINSAFRACTTINCLFLVIYFLYEKKKIVKVRKRSAVWDLVFFWLEGTAFLLFCVGTHIRAVLYWLWQRNNTKVTCSAHVSTLFAKPDGQLSKVVDFFVSQKKH